MACRQGVFVGSDGYNQRLRDANRGKRGGYKQIPLSLRRNLLPGKLLNRTLLMSHQHLARTLVKLTETAKTSSCSNAVLHHPPEPLHRPQVLPPTGPPPTPPPPPPPPRP